MPSIDYKCRRCGHAFERVILRGEKAPPISCPRCGATGVLPDKGPSSLFEGISNFSSLAKDTN